MTALPPYNPDLEKLQLMLPGAEPDPQVPTPDETTPLASPRARAAAIYEFAQNNLPRLTSKKQAEMANMVGSLIRLDTLDEGQDRYVLHMAQQVRALKVTGVTLRFQLSSDISGTYYVRGDEAGLSWYEGREVTVTDGIGEITLPMEGGTHLEFKLTREEGELEWELGNNNHADPGQTVKVDPQFKKGRLTS